MWLPTIACWPDGAIPVLRVQPGDCLLFRADSAHRLTAQVVDGFATAWRSIFPSVRVMILDGFEPVAVVSAA